MPNEVITRVNKMARRNQAQRDISFFYRDGLTPVSTLANDNYAELAGVDETNHNNDDDDDESYIPEEDEEDESSDSDSESEDSTSDNDDNDSENDDNDNSIEQNEPILDAVIDEPMPANNKEFENFNDDVESNEGPIPEEITSDTDNPKQIQFTRHNQARPIEVKSDILKLKALDMEMDRMYGTRKRDGLRNRKPVEYSHLFFQRETQSTTPCSFSHIRDM